MKNPIGICDSGSGGLTILETLAKALPKQSFIYLGDHKRAPYGHRSEEEILKFTIELVETLFKKGCKLVIVACNTASAVALRQIQEKWLPKHYPDHRTLGVLVPMVEALTGLEWDRYNPGISHVPQKNLAVFATQKTVDSGAYPHQVRLRVPNFQVIQQACPGLVNAIENNAREAELKALVSACCKKLSGQMFGEKLDVVFLGCTHYPLVENLFRDCLPETVEILSQPKIVSASLKVYLKKHPEFKGGEKQTLEFLTTGNPENLGHLEKFLHKSSPPFKKN
ncbi:MAG: glutamate racemase [Sphingomonadales bacterium]